MTTTTAAQAAEMFAQDREVQAAAIALRPENFQRWFAGNHVRIARRIAKEA